MTALGGSTPPVTFQPGTALNIARALAQPRRVGTPGEAAAIDLIATRLAAAGCQVERQPFAFSTGAQVATTLEILIAQILILLTFAAWGVSAWAGFIPALSLLALLGLTGRVQSLVAAGSITPPAGGVLSRWQRFCQRLGQRCQTVNIVGQLPHAAPTTSRPNLYLVAHSDSKSQVLPLVTRMVLIGVAVLFAVVFAVLTLLRPLAPGLTSAGALAGLAALVAGVPVLLLFLSGAGNASPGAIDNASGAALVVHLAEVLAAARPNLNLTFLVTGAEELGVVGATAYVQSARQSGLLQRQAAAGLHVLNLDGIGGEGRLALVGGRQGSQLGALVRAGCVELRLPLGRWPLVGALFDHIPFAEAGADAVSLVTVGPSGRGVHTAADSADKLHEEGFRQAGEVALRVVALLSSRPAPTSPTSSGPTTAA